MPVDDTRLKYASSWMQAKVDSVELTYIVMVAFALAMDALAVAWSLGSTRTGLSNGQILRLSASFGFFQFFMLLLGWMGGGNIESLVREYDHWIASGILALIGSKMIWESFRSGAREFRNDPTVGMSLIALSVATSIDALAVGFSFAFANVEIFFSALVVGVVAAGLTAVGMLTGSRSHRLLHFRAELLGGFVLIVIGVRIIVSHVLGL